MADVLEVQGEDLVLNGQVLARFDLVCLDPAHRDKIKEWLDEANNDRQLLEDNETTDSKQLAKAETRLDDIVHAVRELQKAVDKQEHVPSEVTTLIDDLEELVDKDLSDA